MGEGKECKVFHCGIGCQVRYRLWIYLQSQGFNSTSMLKNNEEKLRELTMDFMCIYAPSFAG